MINDKSLEGFDVFKLTGGEPLLYKDGETDILDLIRAIKPLKEKFGFELSLTTNGSLLKKYARDLKKAGLDRVTVSLHSLDPNQFSKITGQKPSELKNVLKVFPKRKKPGCYH